MINICMPVDDITNLDQCISSIDIPFGNILLVNNSSHNIDYISDNIRIVNFNINIGRAASWNLLLQEDHELYLFLSRPLFFYSGELDRFIQTSSASNSWITIGDNQIFSIKPICKEKVGFFDENYYPYGLELEDYLFRLHKLNGHVTYAPVKKYKIEESSIPLSSVEYFIGKWGVSPIESYKKAKDSLSWILDIERMNRLNP
jgi:hypothetical protein